MATVANPGLRREQAGAERRVLPQFVRQPAPLFSAVPRLLLPWRTRQRRGLIAELAKRLCPCLGLGQPPAHEVVHAHLEVKREFFLHVVAHVVR